MSDIPKNLKKFRKESQMTQQELGGTFKCHQTGCFQLGNRSFP